MEHTIYPFLVILSLAVILVFILPKSLNHPSIPATDANILTMVIERIPYDGDTITGQIAEGYTPFGKLKDSLPSEWYKHLLGSVTIRVRGVDTPEMRGQTDKERKKAIEARDFVYDRIKESNYVIYAVNPKKDKYGGRTVADIYLSDGSNLADLLIKEKLGKAYSGGTKEKFT